MSTDEAVSLITWPTLLHPVCLRLPCRLVDYKVSVLTKSLENRGSLNVLVPGEGLMLDLWIFQACSCIRCKSSSSPETRKLQLQADRVATYTSHAASQTRRSPGLPSRCTSSLGGGIVMSLCQRVTPSQYLHLKPLLPLHPLPTPRKSSRHTGNFLVPSLTQQHRLTLTLVHSCTSNLLRWWKCAP